MTHTHDWKVGNYGGFASALCQDEQCKAEVCEEKLEKCLRACDGVTLGGGASVKRLVEALTLFLAVHACGGFVEPDEDVLTGARTALAPFEVE